MATYKRATRVFLHGFTHTGASWDAVIDALGQQYRALAPDFGGPHHKYRTLAPDIRGHGRASERQPVDLEHVLADVSGLVSGSFTLIGYSMGGRIALHVALALGSRIDRLVLIGASPGIADPVQRAQRHASDDRLATELERSTIEQFASSWARTPVLADQPPEVAAAVHADRLRSTPAGLARALRGLGTGVLPSVWGRLGELAAPTTLVVGEHDHKFRQIARAMAEQLANAEVVIVPGSGHAVHLEAPAQVAAIVGSPGSIPAQQAIAQPWPPR